MTIHLILSSPRSGGALLGNCLGMLGYTAIEHEPDADTINRLLLQDMGMSWFTPALPRDWLSTQAAARAKDRIHKLLSTASQLTINNSKLPYIILNNPLLTDLWLQVLHELDIAPQFIHIIRHPHEAALSLQSSHNLDLHQAHILWLAHTRTSLRALEGQNYSLVTFDQLLADPVSTLCNCLSPSTSSLLTPYSSLLDYVQPSLKNFHVSNLSYAEKERFKPYAKLYDQLRATQLPSSAQISEDQRIKILGSSESDLIDSLLQPLGQRASHITDTHITNHKSQLTGLYTTITLPSSRHETGITHTIPLIEDQWQKISIAIPEPEIVSHNQFLLKPINIIGTFIISNIKIVNQSHGKTIWPTTQEKIFSDVNCTDLLKFTNKDKNLVLISTSEEALLTIPVNSKLPEAPLLMEIWVKPLLDINMLQQYLEKIDDRITNEIRSIRNALNKEKADRIHGFAYRDSQGDLPRKYLILLTLHRCGSTYLMDALRTHPDIYIEPRAFLHEYLTLSGSRYPGDLTAIGSGLFLDIEQNPGKGAQVPVLGSHQKPGSINRQVSENSFAIEKIHSEFYFFDTQKFISEISSLKNTSNVQFKFVYIIRDPKSVISSLIKYKKRNPEWYKHVNEDDVPHFAYKEYFYLKEFKECYQEGIIFDYEDLINNFEKTLTKIFMFLWPKNHQSEEYYKEITQRARQHTDRNKRISEKSTHFLGKQSGNIKGGDSDLHDYFQKHIVQIDKCYDLYNELLKDKVF